MKRADQTGSHIDESNFQFTDKDGILFWMTGGGHAIHLLVALHRLRLRDFKGRIAVVSSDDKAKRVVEVIARDRMLNIEHLHHEMAKAGGGKGGHYANKTRMIDLTPFPHRTVFLDADTLVENVDEIGKMLPPNAYTPEVMLTQFSTWKTNGKIMRGRLGKWSKVKGAENWAVMCANPLPAINTGVVGFSKLSSAFFKEWNAVTMRKVCFMCDELAAQLIFPDFPHHVRREEFNCSPILTEAHKISEDGTVENPPVVWHGHGWKFIKSGQGQRVWLEALLRAVGADAGSIRSWCLEYGGKATDFIKDGEHQINSYSIEMREKIRGIL